MKISVIIPSYNRAHSLLRALESVLKQTHPANEIILVDDGSSDQTKQLIQNQFPQVLYIKQTNQGVSAARNRGIKEAKNDWIAFLDSDDEWLPTKLESQISQLSKTNAVLCHTEEIWIRNDKRVNAKKKHRKTGGNIYQQCLPLCVISPSASLIQKSLLLELGGFDEQLPACEDYDLWLKICCRHSVAFVETPQIIKYGGHPDQLSHHYPVMDRFRVTALMNILTSGILSQAQTTWTREILQKKLNILINGAIKRHKIADVDTYQAWFKQFVATQ